MWQRNAHTQPLGIVVNDADYTRSISPIIGSDLQGDLESLGSLIQINASDYVRYLIPEYPLALVGDNSPPEIRGVQLTAITSTSGRFTVDFDEFSITTIRYGDNPLAYTHVIYHALYDKTQVFTLEGLVLKEHYYFQIEATDLSGNTVIYPEYDFIFLLRNFLPLITQN